MTSRVRVVDEARSRARVARIEIGRQIRAARLAAGLPLRATARAAGRSTAWASRVERGMVPTLTFDELAVLAAASGLRLRATTFPGPRAIRDAPQLRLLRRFRERVGEGWTWRYEVVLPNARDYRAADCVMRRGSISVMVEAFTRLADAQAQLREVRVKARDLSVTRTIVVLGASQPNRRAMLEADELVRAEFPLRSKFVLAALAQGVDPGADGVVVL